MILPKVLLTIVHPGSQQCPRDASGTLSFEKPNNDAFNTTHLPFKLQRRVLDIMQYCLERVLFSFLEKWAPEVLKQKGWTDPEEAELSYLCDAVKMCTVPARALNLGWSRNVYPERVRDNRHMAVHRQKYVPVCLLLEMIKEATSLSACLKTEMGVFLDLLMTLEEALSEDIYPFIISRAKSPGVGDGHKDVPAETLQSIKSVVVKFYAEIVKEAVGDI
jgi:hypothetical protein